MAARSRQGAQVTDSPPGSTDLIAWMRTQFREAGAYTALIILVRIEGASVTPQASSYLHVIGDEIDWPELRQMLSRSGVPWNGVALFPAARDGGPLPDHVARLQLNELQARVNLDRLTIAEEGQFFDDQGRRLKLEVVGSGLH